MFTEAELAYLAAQTLGRLATQQPNGTLQANPVGFRYNPDEKTIDVTGHNLRNSKKFRNIATHDKVAFVVDDLPSTNPWRVRCLEIRGRAEALVGVNLPDNHFDDAVIRIHPERILAMGVEDWDREPRELETNFRDV
ncbi:PPOX class F420-dependent oxidoreductase [Amycolatopsis balhimycina DSM 5908]|uniref:PPOX class F420-dependent oxidoreductase n=1 Tax=Amycolatopsis balhimycina DSM 5908 TaxID=1081091 RepID=A0A428WGD5_AMYBA|nr:PPOX class F420-dependent oxidoreductase [Amycolatopsis balhimycina]RSM42093.1 PPOX class F420-dependent oxidoreductase [Amycolatopsis balhimycina DSM 5908]